MILLYITSPGSRRSADVDSGAVDLAGWCGGAPQSGRRAAGDDSRALWIAPAVWKTRTKRSRLNAPASRRVTDRATSLRFDERSRPPESVFTFTGIGVHVQRNTQRAGGLQVFPWTDPVLTAGVTRVRLAHLLELREALTAAYAAAGRSAPGWTDAAPAAGSTPDQGGAPDGVARGGAGRLSECYLHLDRRKHPRFGPKPAARRTVGGSAPGDRLQEVLVLEHELRAGRWPRSLGHPPPRSGRPWPPRPRPSASAKRGNMPTWTLPLGDGRGGLRDQITKQVA